MNATAHRNLIPGTVYNDVVASAWRIACQDVASDILFINQYRKVIEERDERLSSGHLVHSAAYVAACRKWLPGTLDRYLRNLRAVHETETFMDIIGMAYAVRSDDWRA